MIIDNSSYEIILSGILVYFLNFFSGKSKNQKIASQLFNVHREILESQFALGNTQYNYCRFINNNFSFFFLKFR